MCELLESCNGNAANALEQIDLMAQRDRENSSHSDYQRARKRLLHAAIEHIKFNAQTRSIGAFAPVDANTFDAMSVAEDGL